MEAKDADVGASCEGRREGGGGFLTPRMTPRMEDAVREGCVRAGDVRDTGMRQRVRDLVQGALGADDIPADKNVRSGRSVRCALTDTSESQLDELGIDSLTAVEIGVELRRLILRCTLPGDLLFRTHTTLTTLFDALQLSQPHCAPDAAPAAPWPMPTPTSRARPPCRPTTHTLPSPSRASQRA